jgi:hypothetical protein
MRSKIVFITGIIFCFGHSFGQNRRFLNHIENTVTAWYEETLNAGALRIDVKGFDPNYAAGLILGEMNKERIRKHRHEFQQDSLLNRIALAGMETFNKKSFVHGGTWFKERRSIKYALRIYQSENRIYAAHAFVIDMVDLKFSERFYYDKNTGTSSIDLYRGVANSRIDDTEHEDYVAPEPIEAITEDQFSQRLLRHFSKGEIGRNFMSRKFGSAGVAIKMDPASLRSSTKRPQVFVIVIFGGKMLQQIRVPKDVFEGHTETVRG